MVALSDAADPDGNAAELLDRRQANTQPQQAELARNLATTVTAVAAVRRSVSSGGLRLDPEAAERLIGVLRAQQDAVDLAVRRLGTLARPVPLGANPVGSAMEGKFWSRAAMDGDPSRTAPDGPSTDRSLTNMLTRYRRTLDEAEQAVTTAMRQYRSDEDDNVARFRGVTR